MLIILKDDKEIFKVMKEVIKIVYEGVKGDKLKGVKFECLKIMLCDGDEEMDIEECLEFENVMFINVLSKMKL